MQGWEVEGWEGRCRAGGADAGLGGRGLGGLGGRGLGGHMQGWEGRTEEQGKQLSGMTQAVATKHLEGQTTAAPGLG